MPEFIEKQFKSILNKKKFIDSWYWDRYTINPYNGCAFGCIYCDARSDRYAMPIDFENQIVVKQSVGQMLDRRISRARKLHVDVVGVGGVTDAYQGIEKKQKNTQDCLQVLAKHGYPVHIATKSNLIVRDSELLQEIAEKSWCAASVSIATLDDSLARFLDHRSPPPAQRMHVVSELKRRCPNVNVGVNLIPILPYLTDQLADLKAVIEQAAGHGADFVLFGGGVSMNGRSASWFLNKLSEFKPHLMAQYQQLFSFSQLDPYDGLGSTPQQYMMPIHSFLVEQSRKQGLSMRINRFIPDDFRNLNYRCAEVLLNTAYFKQLMGENHKSFFWAGQNIQNLDVSISSMAEKNELQKIPGVNKTVLQALAGLMDNA